MLLKFALIPHFTSAPCIPEIGFSGVVVASGPRNLGDIGDSSAASSFHTQEEEVQIGDEVVGLQWSGTLAEYVVASRSLVARKSKKPSMVESACLPGCGMTAVQACDLAGVKKGDKVLVTGGSGGLGSILVLYAKGVVGERGMVVTTCSGRNEEMVRALGADEVRKRTEGWRWAWVELTRCR